MFLLVLLLILAADILFLKMLTYKKKDEKQYFYKVNIGVQGVQTR